MKPERKYKSLADMCSSKWCTSKIYIYTELNDLLHKEKVLLAWIHDR